jgi:hypothetical protein
MKNMNYISKYEYDSEKKSDNVHVTFNLTETLLNMWPNFV